MVVELTVNGKTLTLDVNPMKRLLDVLREELGLTGVKEGCGEGECGACAVFADGELVNSCLLPIGAMHGREITTIEGYRDTRAHRVLTHAFAEAGAVQCGFCTPGMIMAAGALMRRNPHPSPEEIREGLSGNLCRCTGYNMIVAAISRAAEEGKDISW